MQFQLLAFLGAVVGGVTALRHSFSESSTFVPFFWKFTDGVKYEGIAFYAYNDVTDAPGLVQLQEFHDFDTNQYLYTTSTEEAGTLKGCRGDCINPFGWGRGEGRFFIFPTQVEGTVPLFRSHFSRISFFEENIDHLFTTNEDEGPAAGYKPEGIVGYVYPGPYSNAIPVHRWATDY